MARARLASIVIVNHHAVAASHCRCPRPRSHRPPCNMTPDCNVTVAFPLIEIPPIYTPGESVVVELAPMESVLVLSVGIPDVVGWGR